MKHLTEYRDAARVREVLDDIRRITTRPWRLMEVCGGQTHSIIRHGIDQLLPDGVEMIHGPGCPVCVTPQELIDQAIAIASSPGTILVSFGDMLRVPGSAKDLFQVKAEGGDVRVVYSPLECLKIAQENPDRQVVFFGVGFETTAPANAMAVFQAHRLGLDNFSLLVSHVRVPPALDVLLGAPEVNVQAFLLAGHVCAVMGYWEYEPLVARYRVPMVVTGFEPLDLVHGIRLAIRQLEQGRAEVENAYGRVVVAREGNRPAQQIIETVFEGCDRNWRGIGLIPASGWRLRPDYAAYDAARRFAVDGITTQESPLCHAGDVLKGVLKPNECPAFGTLCTPRKPLGAPMVSSEGACAAYYNFGRFEASQLPLR
ncbi:MAG TPA: hydrogenase formation protein HypD [Aggregatilineaceae bacterium]|nr:hydrogenase formation protein HypD [Aggregatilineaceae bacterium]